MKVDFKVKTAPSYRVAYLTHYGGYSGPNMWRREFTQLTKWTRKRKLQTGKWIMYFIDKWGEKPNRKRRSVAAIEIKDKAKSEGKIQIMKIPKLKVVSVKFDPDRVSDDIVYHALESWLESYSYRQAGRSRELYNGSPWTNRKAWANCEVQVPIKRK